MTFRTRDRYFGAHLRVRADLEEAAVAAFWEAGCLGVEVDSTSRSRNDPRVTLHAYFPGSVRRRRLSGRIARAFLGSGLRLPRPPRLAPVPDRRWAETWQKTLRPMRIGRRFLVVPEGCRSPSARGRLILHVRFGQAFGTGEHASTRMCLRLLEPGFAPGSRVADLGTGAGILAMAAARLGAGRVLAVDDDPVALRVAADNLADNRLEGRVELRRADAAEACRFLGPFDLAVINIGASVIARLLPDLAAALAPGARVILAGILHEDEEPLLARAAALGLELEARLRSRPWSALRLRCLCGTGA